MLEDPSILGKAISPTMSEDESDIESLHSFHYSPKAVDIPSAIRLAKRLYMLDGFKKSDVSRHLSKNNDFSRVVAEEYLKYFTFEADTLDIALRKFLKQFSLTGETQERERVLVHFSKRYLDCNPGTFNSQGESWGYTMVYIHLTRLTSKRLEATCSRKQNSFFLFHRLAGHVFEFHRGQARRGVQSVSRIFRVRRPVIELVPRVDLPRVGCPSPRGTNSNTLLTALTDAVHTLTCAIMLLNTDLHGQNLGRKMTCTEFIENLSELNDGENFPREVLKSLYQAIKSYPLEWALDEEGDECNSQLQGRQLGDNQQNLSGSNPFLDVPNAATAVEYKKGYVMRKCCVDTNGKKTPFGKRSWKMFYCTLRDLVLYLHKDEHGFRKSALSDNLHNAIRIHHALATKAQDYTKKQHVFRLQTADQSEYLFQTRTLEANSVLFSCCSDSKELQSWIDTINLVCASFSAQPLAGAVGSQRKFQRPLLPCSHTRLSLSSYWTDKNIAHTGHSSHWTGRNIAHTGHSSHWTDRNIFHIGHAATLDIQLTLDKQEHSSYWTRSSHWTDRNIAHTGHAAHTGQRDQLRDHEDRVQRLEAELDDHRRHPPDKNTKSLSIQNYKEKDAYLHYEKPCPVPCIVPIRSTGPVPSIVPIWSAGPVPSIVPIRGTGPVPSIVPIRGTGPVPCIVPIRSTGPVPSIVPIRSAGPVPSIVPIRSAGPIPSIVPIRSAGPVPSIVPIRGAGPVPSIVPIRGAGPVPSIVPIRGAGPVPSIVPIRSAGPVPSIVPIRGAGPVPSIVPIKLKRYKTYAYLLRSRVSQFPEVEVTSPVPEGDLENLSPGVMAPPIPDRRASPTTNRYSYRAAIYSGGTSRDNDLG
uniref:Uncharacterized protein n=1 Tax=Timema shepardi TaxID=629360 RepID=A0A7R9G1B4_TIMSH|nr:unnamed protein product [Timema shepardi]